jgi:catechol 2,3-dioxygenase-like lactoylglutathione lyase family enzyme
MAELPPPPEGIVLTHFIVSQDVERSRRFYTEVLGGRVVFSGKPSGEPTNVALSNSFIVISVGGGPTDDKPTVILETPRDPDRVSSFLNIRVKDIEAVYAEWTARGRKFPDAAETAPVRDPLLHPRPRRSSNRSGANHRPRRRLDARSLAIGYARRDVRVNAEITRETAHVEGGQPPDTEIPTSHFRLCHRTLSPGR